MTWHQKKYLTNKYSVRSSVTDREKLEKTHRSELRMISTAAFKFKSKFLRVENPRRCQGETEASNVRMYETHFPGFCYQKDGKYRRRVFSNLDAKINDSMESSEKIKALLFTNNELDIEKVMCLHLLGTHAHSPRYIQRKEGRLCTFIKSQVYGNRCFTLQAISRRTSSKDRDMFSTYDKIIPRYVLEVCEMDRNPSNLSLRTYGSEPYSEEDLNKLRKFQVPVYVNNDVRAIINSVLEALEAVNSPKLKRLVNLARNPEELRNLLCQEYIQEYIIEMAGKQLIRNATSYDFSITYLVFEKVSDSTTEHVAQVLEIAGDSDLRNLLYRIRKTISRRHEELVLCNIIPGKKKLKENITGSMTCNFSRTSFLLGIPSTKVFNSGCMTGTLSSDHCFNRFQLYSNEKLKDESSQLEMRSETKSVKNATSFLHRNTSSRKIGSKSIWSIFPHRHTTERFKSFPALDDSNNEENMAPSNNPEDARTEKMDRYPESEIFKYDLQSLNNSQRILLGLKVASMKCRPVNMHQFESKNKVDIGSIITSIVHPLVSKSNHGNFAEDSITEPEQKRIQRPISKIPIYQGQDIGTLTRRVLYNLRHDIATAENKKRVKNFMDTQL